MVLLPLVLGCIHIGESNAEGRCGITGVADGPICEEKFIICLESYRNKKIHLIPVYGVNTCRNASVNDVRDY